MKIKLFFAILTLFLILGSSAQAIEIEIKYPVLPGVEAPQDFMPKIASGVYPKEATLGLMVAYIYALAVFCAGSICLLAMVYGGVLYFFSGSNPGLVIVAKDQIISAFFAALLLASFYMSLKILNPDLLVLAPISITTPPLTPLTGFPPISQRTESYWELPIGKIEADTLDRMKKMEAPALAVKESSAIVKQKAQEFKDLLNQCQCSNLASACSSVTCSVINPCSGTYETLCPNSNLIAAKKAELLAAATDLENKTNIFRQAAIAHFVESSKLQTAKRIMEICEGEATDLYSYLTIKKIFPTVTKYIWSTGPNEIAPDLDCDQSAPNISLPNTLDKQAMHHLATIWCSLCATNQVLECYNDTARKALAAGINPAFALAIWLNESNASNYNLSVEDFGIHDSSVKGFTAQITRFLSLPQAYKSSFPQCFGHGNEMTAFLRIFRSGNCTDQVGLDYVNNIKNGAWNYITSCPFPSYPTDTSCY